MSVVVWRCVFEILVRFGLWQCSLFSNHVSTMIAQVVFDRSSGQFGRCSGRSRPGPLRYVEQSWTVSTAGTSHMRVSQLDTGGALHGSFFRRRLTL